MFWIPNIVYFVASIGSLLVSSTFRYFLFNIISHETLKEHFAAIPEKVKKYESDYFWEIEIISQVLIWYDVNKSWNRIIFPQPLSDEKQIHLLGEEMYYIIIRRQNSTNAGLKEICLLFHVVPLPEWKFVKLLNRHAKDIKEGIRRQVTL